MFGDRWADGCRDSPTLELHMTVNMGQDPAWDGPSRTKNAGTLSVHRPNLLHPGSFETLSYVIALSKGFLDVAHTPLPKVVH